MFRSKTTDNQPTAVSIVSLGMIISGNIDTHGDVRIDGTLKGNLFSRAKIFIGPEAVIEGDIIAKQADIMGKVEGKIQVDDLLYLRGKAEVNGDIHTMKLVVEPSASFNGQCKMGANVVELSDIARAVNE
jgi:cytoskeletal protein CcmA (bactofilin family)